MARRTTFSNRSNDDNQRVDAATVLCLRSAATPLPCTLAYATFEALLSERAKHQLAGFEWDFRGELEILVGQSEVVNWVRSRSPSDLATMRYGGEWKLPGGTRDPGLYGRSPQPRVLHLEKYDTWWLNFFCKKLGVRSKTWFRRGSRKLNPSNLERIERLKGIDLSTASPKLQNASEK